MITEQQPRGLKETDIPFILKPIDTPQRPEALILDAHDRRDQRRAAKLLRSGKIIAGSFRGIFGIFGDLDDPGAPEQIYIAKNRPKEKGLIQVVTPETAHLYSDFGLYPREDVVRLWRDVHGLGIIFRAGAYAPHGLVKKDDEGNSSLLTIWTEYNPVRGLVKEVEKMGGRGLVGTSANKSGEVTHWRTAPLIEQFRFDVAAIMADDFEGYPDHHKKSTSIIDLTNGEPHLFREGSMSEEEIREALLKHGFSGLHVGRDVIKVKKREYPEELPVVSPSGRILETQHPQIIPVYPPHHWLREALSRFGHALHVDR